MKFIILLITLLFSFSLFAADVPNTEIMSEKEQTAELVNISKNIRREYWQQAYENVESYFEFVTKDILDTNIANNDRTESPLASDQIADLYKCYYGKTCELYVVYVGAEKFGGTGGTDHYVLLYPKSGKHHKIVHFTYAE